MPSSPAPANGEPVTPKTNGVNGDSAHEDEAPTPPPHKESPKDETPAVDAEACKAAGNKFFKAREWKKAIEEYTKGKRYTKRMCCWTIADES